MKAIAIQRDKDIAQAFQSLQPVLLSPLAFWFCVLTRLATAIFINGRDCTIHC